MKIYITRHGETDWNRDHLLCGSTDILLNDKGLEQAREFAQMIERRKDELDIRHIYVSDLRRSQQTASFTEEVLGIKAAIDPRIREMDFGAQEGTDWFSPEAMEIKYCPYQRFPEGESSVQVIHRAYSFLDDVIEKHRKDNENILIVCHGIMALMLSTYFRSYKAKEFAAMDIPNCSLLEYEV